MNCYECAIQGEAVPAVATCPHCNVGMCLEHLQLSLDYRIGGTTYGCRHDLSARPAEPAVTAAAAGSNGHRHLRLRAAR